MRIQATIKSASNNVKEVVESEGTIIPTIATLVGQPYEYQVQKSPVTPKIVSLDSSGLLTIRFNATMNTDLLQSQAIASSEPIIENQFNDDQIIIYGTAALTDDEGDNENFARIHDGTVEHDGKILPSLLL